MSVDDGVFPGAMIGEIQVTGTLGSGGMGEVFSASSGTSQSVVPLDHPDLGRALLELGAIQRRQANFGESAEFLEQALSVFTNGGAGASTDRTDILEEMALLAGDKVLADQERSRLSRAG